MSIARRAVDTEGSAVTTDGSALFIENFVERDPEVVAVIVDVERPALAVHNLLVIGAHATRGASSLLDVNRVEQRFEDMTRDFDAGVSQAVENMTAATSQLMDDERGMPAVLSQLRSDITRTLGETFDGDSKSSVTTQIETLLADAGARIDANVRAAVDPDLPGSPIAKTRQLLIDTVKDQSAMLSREIRELALSIASETGRSKAEARTAVKGFSYEDLVETGVAAVGVIHGDVVERVGTRTGVTGTKKGDILVTVSPEDTCGVVARFVLEAKDRSLSMTKTLAELEQARANHDAAASIAVFSSEDAAPTRVPFWWSGHQAILVYDKEESDERWLQLAYAWARWVCRRALASDDLTDLSAVSAALSRAQQALTRQQTIKSCHSSARKKIDEASAHVNELIEAVDAALRDVWAELSLTADDPPLAAS